MAGEDFPGDRDRDAPVDDGHGQDGEGVAEIAGVEGEGEALVGPAFGDPAEQRPAAIGGVELAAVRPGLNGAGLVEFPQPLADRIDGLPEDLGEWEGDGGEVRGVGEGGGETPLGEGPGVGGEQFGESAGDAGGPIVEWGAAGHGCRP